MSWLDLLEKNRVKRTGKKFDMVNVTIMMPPGSIYTGAGPADQPAMLDHSTNPPQVIHKDELITPTPGGRTVTPSPQTTGSVSTLEPISAQQAPMVQQAVDQGKLPGHATGGSYQTTNVTKPVDPLANSTAPATSATSSTAPMVNTLSPLGETATTQNATKKAFQQLTGIANGNDPLSTTVANRALQRYDAATAVNTTATAQKAAMQPGMTQGAANVAAATAARDASIGRADLTGKLAEDQLQRQQDAAKDVYTLGTAQNNWQANFDEDKRRYQNDQNWMGFEKAAAVGDYGTAAGLYNQATGKTLDTSQMAAYRDYLLKGWNQQTTLGDLEIDAKTYGLTSAKMKDAIEAINSGADLATINSTYGLSLDQQAFDGMREKYSTMLTGAQLANKASQGQLDSLYGYTDPATGKKVMGSLEIAAGAFGLQGKTLEMQEKEMFGYTDPATGRQVVGRMEIMNNEDRRAAESLYGYDETRPDGTVVHHAGTLQLQADQVAIQQQGLDMQSARFYGYTDPRTGQHVMGEADIAQGNYQLLADQAKTQKDSTAGTALAGYFTRMANTAGYDWRNDAGATKYLQDYWTSLGNTGDFPEEWADQQFQASSVNEIDASITQMQNSTWFKGLDPTQQAQTLQIAKIAGMLSVTAGAKPVLDEKGEIIGLKDSQGTLLWGSAGTISSGGGTGASSSVDNFAAFKTSNPDAGAIDEAMWKAAGSPADYVAYKAWYDKDGRSVEKTLSLLDSGRTTFLDKVAYDGALSGINNSDLIAIDAAFRNGSLPPKVTEQFFAIDALSPGKAPADQAGLGAWYDVNKGKVIRLPNGEDGILLGVDGYKGKFSLYVIDVKTGQRTSHPFPFGGADIVVQPPSN